MEEALVELCPTPRLPFARPKGNRKGRPEKLEFPLGGNSNVGKSLYFSAFALRLTLHFPLGSLGSLAPVGLSDEP